LNKKDIALTVGGVLATMVLAWLLYRLQQRDSATAAATAAQDQSTAAANTQDLYSLLAAPSYLQGGGGSYSVDTTGISTNAELGTNGVPENDNSAGDSILSTLLGDLTSSLASSNQSGLIIPTLPINSGNSLNNIPTSAAGALSGTVGNPTQNTTSDVQYVPPISGTVRPQSGGVQPLPLMAASGANQ
jgi:hypothetical protein